MSVFDRVTFRLWTIASSVMALQPQRVLAQGVIGEDQAIGNLPGETTTDKQGLIDLIVKIVTIVLDFLAIIAVLFIIIAGIRLIVSQGEEEQKEKAKKSILYVVIGLIVIILARVIVGFVAGFTQDVINNT